MGGVVWHPSLFAYPGQSKNMLIRRHTNCITRRRQHSIKSSLRYLPAHISNADGVHLFRAGINNVQTGYKEKAHTLLPVSWKESLNKKGADFPQLVHFLENIIENERDLLHKGHEEWWRKSRRTLVAAESGDILTSQSGFLLTVPASCSREECMCVLITHVGEVKQEAREAWETAERLNNKPCRVYTAHLMWGRTRERWVASSPPGR